ncbi:MAG: radical SAM protein [Armatimonadota bacterium]|nr:radical SAM protein [Armatimonadota bacterium]
MRWVLSLSVKEATCRICRTRSILISKQLGVCARCIQTEPARALPLAHEAHARCRRLFGLPESAPQATEGLPCQICVHECRIPEGSLGYCGLRTNRGGKLVSLAGTPEGAVLHWYYDPLPTNCVAMPFCGERETRGKSNLAVFYGACTLNCLFCQNWHYMENASRRQPVQSAASLVQAVTPQVACICYFGGDPTPQLPHALAASRIALQAWKGRICWETNGTMHPTLLRRMIELSLESGGTIKFDLKAWSEPLHIALTGVGNQRTLENFATVASHFRERPDPPLLVASTLLIPGYVDEEEVRAISRFIAGFDPDIPYVLLGFYPHLFMENLPTTSRVHAERCLRAAQEAGLRRVRIGNPHLLSNSYA